MSREIFPGVHWIQECGPNRTDLVEALSRESHDWYEAGREIHVPQNAYLFRRERTLLFDTLSPAASRQIIEETDQLLDGRGLDYLVISHPDVPHAGNTSKILRAHPEARLVAPKQGSMHELYHLGNAVKVEPGDTIDLGGARLEFREATFLDAAMSLWMMDETTNTLFPVDWLGFPHMDEECLRFVDELESEITVARLVEFHGRVMFWYRYVDVAKTKAEIDRLIETLAPCNIASAHGLPIRQGAVQYLEMAKDVVEAVARRGRLGVL